MTRGPIIHTESSDFNYLFSEMQLSLFLYTYTDLGIFPHCKGYIALLALGYKANLEI